MGPVDHEFWHTMDRDAKLCILEHAELEYDSSQPYDDEIPGILGPAITNY